jgi:hypothetical protein
MQRATVGKVMLLKDGDGQYIWQQNPRPASRACCSATRCARRPTWTRSAPRKLPVAFGNFKMGYTIVDRLGISTLRDPYTAKPFVQFYTRKRVGGDVTNFEAIKLLAPDRVGDRTTMRRRSSARQRRVAPPNDHFSGDCIAMRDFLHTPLSPSARSARPA